MIDKKWRGRWLASCLVLTMLSSSPAVLARQATFSDIDTSYARESINFVNEQGIMQGVSSTKFAPAQEISRKHVAIVLAKTLGIQPIYPEQATFTDVAQNEAEYGYVEALVHLGLITGTGSSTFSGNLPITRQDTAVIVARALANTGQLEDKNSLAKLEQQVTDQDQIAPYAWAAVSFVLQEGLLSGYNHMFKPKQTLTRAEVAVIAHRIIERGNVVGDYFWGVEPTHLELKIGEQKQLKLLSQHAPLAYTPTFGLDNPALGTISPEGVFTATSPGRGLITVNIGQRYHEVEVIVHE